MAEEGTGSACLDTRASLYVSISVQQEPGGPACLVDHFVCKQIMQAGSIHACHMANRI